MAGDPSHFEIGVANARRAKSFYGELLGWSFVPVTGDNAWVETGGVRGGIQDGDDASNIVIYFRVSDIEETVRRVRELGGEADDPEPAGEGGRFTSCRDDQGVQFGLHEPIGSDSSG